MRAVDPQGSRIRFAWFDVDGTLTDGRLAYIELPEGVIARMVNFYCHDGQGLAMLRAAGIHFGFISGNSSIAVAARAKDLGASECHLGVDSGIAVYADGKPVWRTEEGVPVKKTGKENHLYITANHSALSGLQLTQCAYMGDDLPDVGAMLSVGLAIAPANATEGAKAAAHYVTAKRGGEGAVREAAEFILRWNEERSPAWSP